jgi:hypothetical protein
VKGQWETAPVLPSLVGGPGYEYTSFAGAHVRTVSTKTGRREGQLARLPWPAKACQWWIEAVETGVGLLMEEGRTTGMGSSDERDTVDFNF